MKKSEVIKFIQNLTIPDLGIEERPHINILHTEGYNLAKFMYAEAKLDLINKINKNGIKGNKT